uniref:BMERB domain-containing protein n=1 Tax=Paramormyrops kingsleyae TaxID=1676925 RepID=A0A3B3RKA6_9TELE
MGKKDDPKLMQEWFKLVQEKNALVRYESELMIFARELELEDRQSRLQQVLRERMAVEGEAGFSRCPYANQNPSIHRPTCLSYWVAGGPAEEAPRQHRENMQTPHTCNPGGDLNPGPRGVRQQC